MNKKYISIVAGLLLLTGCSNNDSLFEPVAVDGGGVKTFSTFTATMGDVAGTRAYLGDGPSENYKRVYWEDNDEILVYSDEEPWHNVYSTLEINGNVATFTGTSVSGNQFFALYPGYGWSTSEDNPNIVFFNLDYYGGAPTSDTNYRFYSPMVAKSSGNNFNFKQTTGLIHVTVGDLARLSSVSLHGNNNENLGYKGYVDLSQEEPVLIVDDELGVVTSKYVSFNYDEGGGYKDAYFVVPPTTFEKGITIEIEGYDENGNWVGYSKSSSQRLVVEKASIKDFSVVNVAEDIESNEAKARAALTALYEALDGDNWNYKDNWNTDAPLGDWYGVYTDGGLVTEISLYNNNLVGEIPAAIGDITTLRRLYLGRNQITSVSAELSKLKSLEYLDLSENQLTTFPEAVLEMPWLYSLHLEYNQISGNLPDELSNLTRLGQLALHFNDFEGTIPPSYFEKLNNLYYLDLTGNRLEGMVTIEQQQTDMWKNCQDKLITEQQEGYGIEIEGIVKEIQLSDEDVHLYVDDVYQLVATIIPDDAYNKELDWQILEWTDAAGNQGWDALNAPIRLENGLITALREGTARISVRAVDGYGAEAFCDCTVTILPATSTGDIEGFDDDDNFEWDNNQ